MFEVRVATSADEAFLRDMFYDALFVPPGCEPFPRSVLDEPSLRKYFESFGGRLGDAGFIATHKGEPIGAVWARLVAGYGHVDDETPELTIAVRAAWRGQGVGSALLEAMTSAVPRLSLSSDKRNTATRLYGRFGFEPVSEDGTSVTMLRESE